MPQQRQQVQQCSPAAVPAESRKGNPQNRHPALEGQTLGRLAVSPACRSMQDKLMWPLHRPSAPQGGGRNPPWPRNIRSKYLLAVTASERKSSSEPLHASATYIPSSGETSSKCWRYNPKRGCSNVRYALRAQTACNVNPSQGGNLGSQHVRNPGAVPGFAQDFGEGQPEEPEEQRGNRKADLHLI